MKKSTKALIIAGILGTAMASQGAVVVTYNLASTSEVDGGVFNSSTHTFTKNIALGGSDATFDLVLTAVATGGNWINGGRIASNRVEPPESGAFSVAIDNWAAGTSGLEESDALASRRRRTED